MSLIDDILYLWRCATNSKTEAEKNRDKYKDVRKTLEKKKKKFKYMEQLRSDLEADINHMGRNPNSAEGDFYETFKDRHGITKKEINKALKKMENAISDVEEQLKKVEEKEKYWDEQIEIERGNCDKYEKQYNELKDE